MKYLMHFIYLILVTVPLIWYFITGGNIFLYSSLCFIGLSLFAWYLESRITSEWKSYMIKKHRSGIWFCPAYFQKREYYFICNSYERGTETGVSKIIGFTRGFIHSKSIRIGYRRFGEWLQAVLYIYDNKVLTKIDLGVGFKEGQMCYVRFELINNTLNFKFYNLDTEQIKNIEVELSFGKGYGFQCYPYSNKIGFKSSWTIRK